MLSESKPEAVAVERLRPLVRRGDETAYQTWKVQAASQSASQMAPFLLLVRLPVAIAFMLWNRADIRFCCVITAICLSGGVLVLAMRLVSRRLSHTNERNRALRVASEMMAIVLAQVLSSWIAYCMPTEILQHRTFFCVTVLFQMLQPWYMLSARRLFFGFALPFNCLTFLSFHYAVGFLCPTVFVQCLAQAAMCACMFTKLDSSQRALFQSKANVEREKTVKEEESRRAETWKTVFQGMLDSVFDASCVCDMGGVIDSSTPQMDHVLLTGHAEGAAGLCGRHLLDFAVDQSERQRAQHFLTDVVKEKSTVASRISITLRRETSQGFEPVEVSLSGITMPAGCDKDGSATAMQLFIGLQISKAVPDEVSSCAESDITADINLTCALDDAFDMALPNSVYDVESIVLKSCALPEQRWETASNTSLITKSAYSAPPILIAPEDETEACGGLGCQDDCLPPNSMVFVEGKPNATCLGNVESGQRILCYDQLSRSLKYTDVLGTECRPATIADWLLVTLADGTKLQMTTDHPVFPQQSSVEGLDPLKVGRSVKACELTSDHRIQVMKMCSKQVASVRPLTQSLLEANQEVPNERVSIAVHQPARHSIFVQSSADAGCSMAVAANNLPVQEHSNQFCVKNSFVDMQEAKPSRRRAASEPPRARDPDSDLPTRVWPASAANLIGRPALDKVTSAQASSEVSLRQAVSVMSERMSEVSFSTVRTGKSARTATSALSSESTDGRSLIILAGGIADRRQKTPYLEESVRLGDMLAAAQLGLSSVGSVGHHGRWCSPCVMNTWHRTGQSQGKRGEPCRFGALCNRCHECHREEDIKEVKQLRRKKARQLVASRNRQ